MTDVPVNATRTVHVVPHTHWDREWYLPFQRFRLRLVELLDRVLAMLAEHPEFRFTLDGQTAALDDYLAIRPDRAEDVRRFAAEGRLALGPWQILLDEFLVSGENIIRNLEGGLARADEAGGAMPVGYLPDMFGHVAQMPQILQRAGISDAVVWRGVPEAIDRNAFVWEAPDGSAVRTEYLLGGYGNGVHLFEDPDVAPGRLERFVAAMAPYFEPDGDLLAMHGTDHAFPRPDLAAVMPAIEAASEGLSLRFATLAEYIALARRQGPPAQRWQGEMRSGARANLLMGVTSNHVDVRAAAAAAERRLERYAEPLMALHGGEWPQRLLDLAWTKVVENSAHDSICACSADAVVDQVLVRFAEADQIAQGLAEKATARLADRVARDSFVVVNPSPQERRDLVEFDVALPEEWDDVALETEDGRRVITQAEAVAPPLLHIRRGTVDDVLAVFDLMHGRELYGRQLNGYRIEQRDSQVELFLDLDVEPDPLWLDVQRVRADTERELRGLSASKYAVYLVGRARRKLAAMVSAPPLGGAVVRVVPGPGDLDGHGVQVGADTLDNGLVRVRANTDGTVDLEGGGIRLAGVGRIANGGDAGDSYNYGPPAWDVIVDEPTDVTIRRGLPGPVRGQLVVDRVYEWPTRVLDDRSARSDECTKVTVRTLIELRPGEPFARFATIFDNHCADHRTRWHVPLPAAAECSHAEGQFAVVARGLEAEGGHGEEPLPTYPARGFVSAGGVTVLLDHITEYELLAGEELALTLVRAVGLISRNDHPLRHEPAGPEVPIPAAQCQGPVRRSFAVYPHRGSWADGDALAEMERFHHPFLHARGRSDTTTARSAGLEVEGRGVVLSALRRRGDELEIRIICQHPEPTTAAVRGGIRAARRTDLRGRPLEELTVDGGAVRLSLRPWEIATLRLVR